MLTLHLRETSSGAASSQRLVASKEKKNSKNGIGLPCFGIFYSVLIRVWSLECRNVSRRSPNERIVSVSSRNKHGCLRSGGDSTGCFRRRRSVPPHDFLRDTPISFSAAKDLLKWVSNDLFTDFPSAQYRHETHAFMRLVRCGLLRGPPQIFVWSDFRIRGGGVHDSQSRARNEIGVNDGHLRHTTFFFFLNYFPYFSHVATTWVLCCLRYREVHGPALCIGGRLAAMAVDLFIFFFVF